MRKLVGLLLVLHLMASCALDKKGALNSSCPATQPAQLHGLEMIWTLSIGSNRLAAGVASDSSKHLIYAIAPDGYCKTIAEISSDGKLEREFTLKKWNRRLRTAYLRSRDTRDLISFTTWVGGGFVALDTNGSVLWTHTEGHGIDDVWIADLDGDGFDEVVVGYNGSTGLHVLDRHGKLLWKNQEEGNVWHVCAADLEGDGKPEVITTSAKGKVRVFRGDGRRLPDIEPPAGYYGNLVRPIKLSRSGRTEGILLTGSMKRVAALRGDGTLAWEVQLSTSRAGDVAEPAPDKPWIVLVATGRVTVIETVTGSIIAKTSTATTERGHGNCYACWLAVKGESSPLLILSKPHSIEAYRVTGEMKTEAGERNSEVQ